MKYFLSIIGAIFIVMGLYTVVWGKSKDPIASTALSKEEKINELPVTDTTKSISVSVTSNSGGPLEMSKISTPH